MILLLNAIAAEAVRGTTLHGALVINTTWSGIDSLALGFPQKLMITGAMLLAAVALDAIARERREAAGR